MGYGLLVTGLLGTGLDNGLRVTGLVTGYGYASGRTCLAARQKL
jgi:hypothetical protein